jgi:hypothetical protein
MPTFAPHLVDLLQVAGELGAVDDDAALLVLLQPVDAADHGGLAGADGPQMTMRSPRSTAS